MALIRRIFVEKRPGFEGEALRWRDEFRTLLNIMSLERVRLFNRYDIQGMQDASFERACATIFAEPNADDILYETLEVPQGWTAFAMEYLPGQYDMRADSAVQCAQMLGDTPLVRTARVFLLQGALDDQQIDAIKRYCINPVESREASMDKPQSLVMEAPVPDDIPTIDGFVTMEEQALTALHQGMGLAMSLEDLAFTQQYFREQERRDPYETEIRVLDTYWSDHCRHTTFSTVLTDIGLPDGAYAGAFQKAMDTYEQARAIAGRTGRDKTLMDLGTVAAKALRAQGKLDNLDESEEINACSVVMPVTVDGREEQWLLQFKNETHNHPTEIEPFGGAATCLGGAIRDILAGRGYAHQAMRVTGCADPLTPLSETVPGRLPQRQITTGAAAGFSSYGNQIGIATGQVTEIYDAGYVAKRMEVGAVVGAVHQADVVRLTPDAGDVVVLLGGATGRDGIGGATGSSVSHDTQSLADCGSQVQKGNAPTERKIQRLMKNADAIKLIKRCNDFGAGGVCVAIGELAPGLIIDLDAVPKKYEGLNGTELAISESQERMAMVLAPRDVAAFIAHAEAENLQVTVVAEVTAANRLVMRWRGTTIVDIGRDFLDTNGVKQQAQATIMSPDLCDWTNQVPASLQSLPLEQALVKNMAQLNTASQKGLVERFDSTIGAGTVLLPFGGKRQLTAEEAMVAKLPVQGETDDATAMAFGFCAQMANWSPLHAGAFAVVQSMMKLCAVGADTSLARLSFQEYFESLKSNRNSWGKPTAALLGALRAQMGLQVAAIGGKDSMSGTFNEYNVPPTLISFAIAPTKASQTVSAVLESGQCVGRIALPLDEDGLPDFAQVERILTAMQALASTGKLRAASVVSEGGMAAALCRMCLGNGVGFTFEKEQDQASLFACRIGDLLVAPDAREDLEGLNVEWLGQSNDSGVIAMGAVAVPLATIEGAWSDKLESVFATQAQAEVLGGETPLCTARSAKRTAPAIATPRVVIPVFPGNNCELDVQRSFERAGAQCTTVVVNNLNQAGIEDTLDRLVKSIDNAQILMLPGGFSAGDEPDGSGKFIAVTLRNERIARAIERLLYERDGLALGICNGFQALIKLGLLPDGRIETIAQDAPTLTYNSLGRHVSTMVNTRVTSTKSPWMALCEAGEVHAIPVSHGEGRFVCNAQWLQKLSANGQIATQYVDETGAPALALPDNPNGSVAGIEGIFSPDGRVFGKMGHSERIGANIAKNVPGHKDQRLFEAGVLYFR